MGGGFDFVHVAIDDRSRFAYVEVHADERADTVAGFTARAIAHYAGHGITVKRLLTDGWAYHEPYGSNEERLAALPRWVFNYNHRRPHGGIGGLPPISRVPGVNNVSGQNS